MKKLFAMLLAGTMLFSVNAFAEATTEQEIPEGVEVIDAIGGASVMDFYGDFGIYDDELMNAINSYSGSYAVSTVNEDGTPHIGFYVYSMVKDEDTYYLILGLAENQTRLNLERTGQAMALYAANPEADADAQYAVTGARMSLELVTDEELVAKLNTTGYDTAMVCEVTGVRSLG